MFVNLPSLCNLLQQPTLKWVEDKMEISKTFPKGTVCQWVPNPMGENKFLQMYGLVKFYNMESRSSDKLPGCGRRKGGHFLERKKNQSSTGCLSDTDRGQGGDAFTSLRSNDSPAQDSQSSQTTNWGRGQNWHFQTHSVSDLSPSHGCFVRRSLRLFSTKAG